MIWEVLDGDWRIENGQLVGKGEILCKQIFPGAQRLEFEAISENPGDLTGLLRTTGVGWRGGYFFGFGTFNPGFPI